jgi:hypothetical protein
LPLWRISIDEKALKRQFLSATLSLLMLESSV